jgi:four helix bundle protein
VAAGETDDQSVYEMTTDFPGSEEFGPKTQMRRAAVSICSNIAEGCGRRGDREFRRFLDVAMGSACELECETILSVDLAFITQAVHEEILDTLIQIKRMLGGLLSRLGWGRLPDQTRNRNLDPSAPPRSEADS